MSLWFSNASTNLGSLLPYTKTHFGLIGSIKIIKIIHLPQVPAQTETVHTYSKIWIFQLPTLIPLDSCFQTLIHAWESMILTLLYQMENWAASSLKLQDFPNLQNHQNNLKQPQYIHQNTPYNTRRLLPSINGSKSLSFSLCSQEP